jgi:hypothetical protein
MLRVADRFDRLGSKWRDMATRMLDESKRGALLATAGKVAAGGALFALGAGALASAWSAREKAREDKLMEELQKKQSELRGALETQISGLQALVDEKTSVFETRLAASNIKVEKNASRIQSIEDNAKCDKQREGRCATEASALVDRAFSQISPKPNPQVELQLDLERKISNTDRLVADQQNELRELRRKIETERADSDASLRDFQSRFDKLRLDEQLETHGKISEIEREVKELAKQVAQGRARDNSVEVPESERRAGIVESLMALTASLSLGAERAERATASALSVADEMREETEVMKTQLATALSTVHRVVDEANGQLSGTNRLRQRVGALEEALAAIQGAEGAGSVFTSVSFGWREPLVLTLARALGAVGQSERRKVAETMAGVLLAEAALEAHRKLTPETTSGARHASDLYT